jgi:hypothetical protein
LLQSIIFWDEKKVVDPGRPGSLMNSTGVGYNFITHTKNKYPDLKSLVSQEKFYPNKKKSIAEIADLQRLYYFNKNASYQAALKSGGPNTFKSPKGMCAEDLNLGKKYYPISQSFKKRKYV